MIHGFHGATQGGFTGISKARAVNVLFCTSACSATNNRTAPGTATRLPRDSDKRQTRNTSCKPPSSARALGTGFSHEGMGHRETVAATPTMAVPVHSTVLSFVPEINACSGHGDGSMGDMRWTWLSACRLYWPLFPQKTLVTVTRQYLTHQIIHRPAASGWNDRLVPANCSPAASPAPSLWRRSISDGLPGVPALLLLRRACVADLWDLPVLGQGGWLMTDGTDHHRAPADH